MDNIKRLKTIVNKDISFIEPINLKKLAKDFLNSNKFPDISSSFEFPPKSVELVLNIILKKEYKKLNFFDISRLLSQLEQGLLTKKILNKSLFVISLQEIFNENQQLKHVQNLILKVVVNILLNNKEHYFYDYLSKNMNSKEFIFIKICIKKDFQSIEKSIKNQSIQKVLKYFGVHRLFNNLQKEYAQYLINNIITKKITDINLDAYMNNLLRDEDLDDFYSQLNTIITIIEGKQNLENNYFLDLIISSKLGNIENKTSKWHELVVPLDQIERYKRLKGLFEFQVFVNICKYLSPSLENTNLSRSGKTSDSDRVRHRSDFWSNYDSMFLSVKMWVSEEDYKEMSIDMPVDLTNIKQLKNISNEVCMLEFKNTELLIIEFFRLRDGYDRIYSLVFEGDIIHSIKEILSKSEFSIHIYNNLKERSSYTINQDYCWQGWLDKFLRDRDIYPNELILQGKNKFKGIRYPYRKELGLEETRAEALSNDRIIRYQDIIIKT